MGRHVYCQGNWVWKYVFAGQNSEQCRIFEDLDLGDYIFCPLRQAKDQGYSKAEIKQGKKEGWINNQGYIETNGDILTLTTEDIEPLKQYLIDHSFENLKNIADNLHLEHEGCSPEGWILGGSTYDKALKNFADEHDYYFLSMIEAYINFMEANPDINEFEFEGEF